ncbi:hypothetical protein [Clostridium ljungdahlii]|uniref:hypothetical protein n=1 Tax=Clostridium ljungdahlii TaxID=1538 RepID=UPI003863B154
MKRESEGIVIETSESIAKVRASRHGDCKSCGACPGDNAIVVDAKIRLEQNLVNMLFLK